MIHTFRTGGDRNLAYLIADEQSKLAAVVDPSYDPLAIVAFARDHGYSIEYAFNTHDHSDHTNGNAALERATGVCALKYGDTEPKTGRRIEHEAVLPLGGLTLRILHTPGHTPDSICLLANGAVFTGDTLFVGKVGGTNLAEEARAEYRSLHETLLRLPDETRVYPGHDVGRQPESTIGEERQTNPFLLQPDFSAFLQLKSGWAEYKKEHGIT